MKFTAAKEGQARRRVGAERVIVFVPLDADPLPVIAERALGSQVAIANNLVYQR